MRKFIFVQIISLPASQKEYVCTLEDDTLILHNKKGIVGLSS